MSLSSWVHKFSICFRNIYTYIWILLTLKLTPTYQCDFRYINPLSTITLQNAKNTVVLDSDITMFDIEITPFCFY
jgi:hypothetical protein